VKAATYSQFCENHNKFTVDYTLEWTCLENYVKQYVNNPFVCGAVFMDVLAKTRRTRFVLQRFFRGYLPRRPKEICNKVDFSMTPISEIKPALLFYSEEQGKRYAFVVSDLLNIVKQALTHNIDIHSAPRHVLNPFTRSPFRNETLYLFFLKVHESHFMMPMLFYRYVKVGFDLKMFLTQNDCMLREYAIRSCVNTMPHQELNVEIRTMLNEIRVFDVASACYKTILPNVALLPATAITQFKPWLHMYYVYQYSLSPALREKSYKKLIQFMVEFIRENPEFGRVKKGVVRATTLSPPKGATLNPM